MLTIDTLAHTNRWRSLHPLEKILPGGLLLLLATSAPVFLAPWVICAAFAASIFGAQIPFTLWLRVLAWPATFILSGALGIALVVTDGPGWLPVWVTQESLLQGSQTALRSFAGMSCVVFVGSTTPMSDLIAVLRKLKVPAVFTDLMMTMYRLLFDLLESGSRLRVAHASRLGQQTLRASIKSTVSIIGVVFAQSMQRAQRLQVGLDARGYTGELKVLSSSARFKFSNLCVGLGSVFVVVVMAAVSNLLASNLPASNLPASFL